MSHMSVRPGLSTSSEAGALTNLFNLATSGAGFAIAKTGPDTFANVSIGGASITIGTTTITSGTTGRILYDNAGVVGEMTTTGSGTVVALATSPVFVTPALGVATATTLAIGGATIGTDALSVTGTIVSSSTISAGTHLTAGATSRVGWVNRSRILSPGDGTLLLTNTAQTAFTSLQFGVSTSSGVALKSTTTTLGVRLGDDSADAAFTALTGLFSSTITGSAIIPSGSSAPTNGMYLPAANTLGWAVNSAAELQLTATAFSPAVDGGNSLGTTVLGWQNFFANTGFVLNIENGDWVATHTAGILTVTTGDLRVTSANVGTNADSVPTLSSTSTLTNKTLTTPTITKPQINARNQTAQAYSPAGAGTATLDLSLGDQHDITMPSGNITIALSNDTNNQIFTISILQDATGSRTVTWFTTIRWAGGSPPTLTTTASKRDRFTFVRTGSGTYDGMVAGQNI